ncbi:MAG: tRNA (guanosine(37)-N1)-methyltransferase TrmD [Parcubacteria group bacterium]|nr:tRNA (guanosine(37)-N1)-methyltransferase TrmD [Parcubacteria group bacterium]
MNFHIITLFPDAFSSYLSESILKRAILDKKIKIKFYDPKDFEKDKKKRVDDRPYAGGPGMVIRALPVIKAIERAIAQSKAYKVYKVRKVESRKQNSRVKIIWLSPGGKQFDTIYAKQTAKKFKDIIIVCGRYEGIDARVKKVFKMENISVGPFVVTGGELPAMIILDCISRQVPGVLGDINSLEESRTASSDVYTRPEVFEYKSKKYRVPKVLLSGDHKKIEEWRKRSA